MRDVVLLFEAIVVDARVLVIDGHDVGHDDEHADELDPHADVVMLLVTVVLVMVRPGVAVESQCVPSMPRTSIGTPSNATWIRQCWCGPHASAVRGGLCCQLGHFAC